jgi:hypothetical protein
MRASAAERWERPCQRCPLCQSPPQPSRERLRSFRALWLTLICLFPILARANAVIERDSGAFSIDTRFYGFNGFADSGLFSINTLPVSSESGTVWGQVTTLDGSILAEAQVMLTVGGLARVSAQSDANGQYQLPAVVTGDYWAYVSRPPFLSQSVLWHVATGLQRQDFALKSPPASPIEETTPGDPSSSLVSITPPSEDQLKVYNGQEWISITNLEPAKLTVVMTHGFNSSVADWPSNLAKVIWDAKSVSATPESIHEIANLVAWDWSSAASGLDLGAKQARTTMEGKVLSQALLHRLGADYSQPIHFLGHSLGTLVNARAADELHRQGYDPQRTQMTLLDDSEQAQILLFLKDHLSPTLWNTLNIGTLMTLVGSAQQGYNNPLPAQYRWSDNYISQFGLPHLQAVNVLLNLGSHFTDTQWTPTLHAYAPQWYHQTAEDYYRSVMGHVNSFERQGVDYAFPYRPDNDATLYHQINETNELELSVTSAVDAYKNLLQNTLTLANEYTGVYPTVRTLAKQGNVVLTYVEQGVSYLGEIIQDLEWSPRITLTTAPAPSPLGILAQSGPLTTNVPAYAWLSVDVPANATHVRFSFLLRGDPQQDALVFGINSRQTFALAASALPSEDLNDSGLLEVRDYAGQEVKLFFGVTGGTSSNATIQVDALRFYSAPVTPLALKCSPEGVLLSWPLVSSAYSLDFTENLRPPIAWKTMTNAVQATNEQFQLHEPSDAPERYYWLRTW